jgi:hypothetical protein
VATLALHPVLTKMNVVVAVTGGAVAGQTHFGGGLAMARNARNLTMRTRQREPRLQTVIEVPLRPAVGIVACRAVATECALVNVSRSVTCDALLRRALECLVSVALRARYQHVHTDQRVGREIVIEVNVALPTSRAMTAFAARG